LVVWKFKDLHNNLGIIVTASGKWKTMIEAQIRVMGGDALMGEPLYHVDEKLVYNGF
jgi:hypothetical protein